MFELENEGKEKIKILGKEYDVEKPTVKQLRDLNKIISAKDADEDIIFDTIVKFLSDLGIESGVCDNLQMKQLRKLVEYLSGGKKN